MTPNQKIIFPFHHHIIYNSRTYLVCIERRYSEEYDDDDDDGGERKKRYRKTENIKPVQWGWVTTLSQQKNKIRFSKQRVKASCDDISRHWLVGWWPFFSMHTKKKIEFFF